MTRITTEAAEAAKLIRKELKKNNIKATVKSKNYSMGSSVNITVYDQAPWTMKAIKEFCEKYEYGTFDAMTDCSGFKNKGLDIPQAKHVFVDNDASDELKQKAWNWLLAHWAGFEGAPKDVKDGFNFRNEQMQTHGSEALYRAISGDLEGFWSDRNVNVKAKAA